MTKPVTVADALKNGRQRVKQDGPLVVLRIFAAALAIWAALATIAALQVF